MKLAQTLSSDFYQRLRRLRWKYHEWIHRQPRQERTFRQKEKLQLIERPEYAYGLLKAADITRYFGKQSTTVCEFGVASGAGLINMIDLARLISSETGVKFRIVGFDTGQGLTEITGFKDHPEVWSQGDYPMINQEELIKKLGGQAELVLGDIRDTVEPFVNSFDCSSPIGFISIDVDIYSSTKHALRCLLGNAELYNPAVSMHFDDVNHFFANDWCGELAAIHEFNNENGFRKIGRDRTQRHSNSSWFKKMYVCHILDHQERVMVNKDRKAKITPGGNLPDGVLK